MGIQRGMCYGREVPYLTLLGAVDKWQMRIRTQRGVEIGSGLGRDVRAAMDDLLKRRIQDRQVFSG